MYDALDALQLSSTQWNYTASNRNDLRVGDGWNQEDLSIFSPDQAGDPGRNDPDAGARGLLGFCRPYAPLAQGVIGAMRYADGRFELTAGGRSRHRRRRPRSTSPKSASRTACGSASRKPEPAGRTTGRRRRCGSGLSRPERSRSWWRGPERLPHPELETQKRPEGLPLRSMRARSLGPRRFRRSARLARPRGRPRFVSSAGSGVTP